MLKVHQLGKVKLLTLQESDDKNEPEVYRNRDYSAIVTKIINEETIEVYIYALKRHGTVKAVCFRTSEHGSQEVAV